MGAERFAGEAAQNMEMKCLCVLVLDVSGSMKGEKLKSLNQGVKDFFLQIQNEQVDNKEENKVSENLVDQLEVAIIKYDEAVEILRDPKLLDEGEIPPELTERGSTTETVVAIEEAIRLVEDRKDFYKTTGQKYYRPWIILMTDGEPYGSRATQADIDAIAERVKSESEGKKYMMMGIGVGDANMEILKKMCAGRALPLEGTKFCEFFQWLSNSLSTVSISKEGDKVDLSDGMSSWMKSFEI